MIYRDFANGFLLAEILSKFFPDDIKMHSFENVTSIKRKKSNWHVLLKFFKVVTETLHVKAVLICCFLTAGHDGPDA